MNKDEIVENMKNYVETIEKDALADSKLVSKVVDKIIAELEREFKNED